MAETTSSVLLAAVTEMESAAFRAGQVARRLIAEHPHLTVRTATAGMHATVYSDGERSGQPRLELRTADTAGTHTWADALGAEPESRTKDVGSYVYESVTCTATVDGVLVEVSGSRPLDESEAAAWRAAGDQGDGGDS
ncbi:hypothetical protein ABZ733_08225 [Streptomyces longwoodensis]|uniref:hypothetical protein n=1 Tax=Streptomyces longwoodensis TaxID=68231 RepID=UPI003401F6F6